MPNEATWDARRQEWLHGHKDLTGQWDGLVTGYDAAGLVRSRQQFAAGVAEGPYVRLHPSGAEAYRALFVEGKLHGDARALSSDEPGAVPLRGCCVPPGARALVTRYEHGYSIDQWFENAEGWPLLADGSRRPDRPATVPAAARYDENRPCWELGELAGLAREGLWQRWLPGGDLLDVASYRGGKLHGSARMYQGGKLTREREYVNGVPHGPAAEYDIAPGTLEDDRIRCWRGRFEDGSPAGRWTYSDGDGCTLFDRDFGAPRRRVELTHPVFAATASDAAWEELGDALCAAGDQGLALCARMRATIAARNTQALRERLRALTVPLGSAENARRLAELKKSRKGANRPLQREEELAACVQALLEGASPAVVLGQLAALLLGAPRAALDFIDAAMALEPSSPSLLAVHAQLLFELGQPGRALDEAQHLAAAHPRHAEWVRNAARLFFPDFQFWPARATFDLEPNPELPTEVGQSLDEVRSAIVKSAVRLSQLRRTLVEAWALHARTLAPDGAPPEPSCLPEPAWLPPELSSLLPEALPKLERYEFTEMTGAPEPSGAADTGGEPELVKVDETLRSEGLGTTALMRLARVEWTCLCWLCWGAGLDRVGLPAELRPPPAFARALAGAFFQVFRVLDSMKTRGLRSKARGLPAARWEGLNVDTLEPRFIEMAFHEARETRAVLYWLGDEECRSLWQDDLRDI